MFSEEGVKFVMGVTFLNPLFTKDFIKEANIQSEVYIKSMVNGSSLCPGIISNQYYEELSDIERIITLFCDSYG